MLRASESAEEIFAFSPLIPFLRGDFSGMEVCWAVRSKACAPPPTYAEVVRALPCMEVRHDGAIPIPESVLQLLRPRQVNLAMINGTGATWYALDLSVVLDPKKEKNAASLQSELLLQLRTHGFAQQKVPKKRRPEVEFYKWTPETGSATCQANLTPRENELSIGLSVVPK